MSRSGNWPPPAERVALYAARAARHGLKSMNKSIPRVFGCARIDRALAPPICAVKAVFFNVKVNALYFFASQNLIFTICIFIPLSPTLARNRKKLLTEGSLKSL